MHAKRFGRTSFAILLGVALALAVLFVIPTPLAPFVALIALPIEALLIAAALDTSQSSRHAIQPAG